MKFITEVSIQDSRSTGPQPAQPLRLTSPAPAPRSFLCSHIPTTPSKTPPPSHPQQELGVGIRGGHPSLWSPRTRGTRAEEGWCKGGGQRTAGVRPRNGQKKSPGGDRGRVTREAVRRGGHCLPQCWFPSQPAGWGLPPSRAAPPVRPGPPWGPSPGALALAPRAPSRPVSSGPQAPPHPPTCGLGPPCRLSVPKESGT